MITVSHLTKEYRGKRAVDDLSFTVKTGKVTGFLGPNGAGKSTTMRLMLGLNRGAPTGSTLFDGKPLHAYKQPSQVVGILLEVKSFHPTRSARQHLEILAEAGGIPLSRVNAVLDEVGLLSVAKKSPGKFSLGMAQRLGIAAAILGEPKYLMLDEPANGLDPEGIAWLREFLKDYASRGNAVFVSSHLISEMALMANDVVVIGQGKLIADTSIETLISENAQASTFARVKKMAPFEAALKKQKLAYQKADGGFKVLGTTTDELGKLAADAGTYVLELTNHRASLEDVFLELTAGKTEYTKGAK